MSEENDNEKIIDLLYRINYYPGLQRLITIVHKANPAITKEEVKKFYDKDITTQLTKVQPKTKPTGHIVSYALNELWQMDIFDLSRYQYFNNYYKYLLVAIDVFSRKAFAVPLLNKEANTVKEAFIKMTKIVKPRSIISDHDSAFLSKEFTSYLDKLQIPLNVNAIGDHHVLGIIDNFAKRIKTILTSTFLKNNSTKWIHIIDNILRVYNDRDHEALGGLSPNEATHEANKPQVLQINLDKKLRNMTISDLVPGDKVRKNVLYNDKYSKGSDPKWSEKVFEVVSMHGNTIILNDQSMMKRNNLLKVSDDAVSYRENVVTEAKRINKEINKQSKEN